MKGLEDHIAASIAASSAALTASARRGLIIAIVFSVIVVGFTIAFILLLTRMLRDVHDITLAARRIADGDLTVDVQVSRRDEIGELQDATARTVEKLAQTIGDVVQAADSLSSAADQVSVTAQSLSQSTSEQAAAVEQTSASVEQIAASISQNTDNAKVTDSMAGKAAKEAVDIAERATTPAARVLTRFMGNSCEPTFPR